MSGERKGRRESAEVEKNKLNRGRQNVLRGFPGRSECWYMNTYERVVGDEVKRRIEMEERERETGPSRSARIERKAARVSLIPLDNEQKKRYEGDK